MLTTADSEEFHHWRTSIRDAPVAVVMTMGALHEGHLALIQEARKQLRENFSQPGYVVVTIYVNPTQFDDSADYETYPQSNEQDVALCKDNRVDVVFFPTTQQIYPEGISNVELLVPSQAAEVLDGPLRPRHFDGVVTVVSRLFDIIRPTIALFGEKDYQQLVVIRDLVAQQGRKISIVAVPTVRESDGLARSSRNVRLSITGRALAKHIPATISLVKHALVEGQSINEARAIAFAYLHDQPGVELEYVEVLTPELTQVQRPGPARVFIALKIGGVRLIDNALVEIGEENVARN